MSFLSADDIRTMVYMSCYLLLLCILGIIAALRHMQRLSQEQNEDDVGMTSQIVSRTRSTTSSIHNKQHSDTLMVQVEIATSPDTGTRSPDSALLDAPLAVFDNGIGIDNSEILEIKVQQNGYKNINKTRTNSSSIASNVSSRNSVVTELVSEDGTITSDIDHDNIKKNNNNQSDYFNSNQNEYGRHVTCFEYICMLCSFKFFRIWCRDLSRLKNIYGVVLVYSFDIVTDINVMIFWFNQAFVENIDYVEYFAIGSLLVIVFYRVISSWSIYNATSRDLPFRKRLCQALLQFCDLFVLLEVFRSHKGQRRTNRLLWINAMEAALEATPQVILQGTYLILFNISDDVVVIGLFFSVWKLAATVIGADKLSVVKKAKNVSSGYRYFVRFFFRVFEIASRVFVYILIWTLIDGITLIIIVAVHLCHNLLLFYGGCLGREIFNIFGYIIYIPKLNKTLQGGRQISCLQNNFYIKFYRECYFAQTRMLAVRCIELVGYWIWIVLTCIYQYNFNYRKICKSDSIKYVNSVLINAMVIGSIGMIIVTPLLWIWILHARIIDFDSRIEQIAFKSIFKAIALNRLDTIKEHFYSKEYVTTAIEETQTINDTSSDTCTFSNSTKNKNISKTKNKHKNKNKNKREKQLQKKIVCKRGMTPLQFACQLKRDNIVQWMINESEFFDKKNINNVNLRQETAFYIACKYGCLKCVKTLVNFYDTHEIGIKIDKFGYNDKNHSILYCLCYFGRDHILKYFFDNVNNNNNNNNSVYNDVYVEMEEMIKEFGEDDKNRDPTPLHVAISRNHTECVRTLLEYSKNIEVIINKTDQNNLTPIELAVRKKRYKISSLLIDDDRLNISVEIRKRLWVSSIENDDSYIMAKLLELNPTNIPNSNVTDTESDIKEANCSFDVLASCTEGKLDDTPMLKASRNNAGSIIKLVLKQNDSTVNLCDSRGHTPLYISCMRGHCKAAISLIEWDKTDLFFTAENENSVLMVTCESDNVNIFKALCRKIMKKHGNDRLKQELAKTNQERQSAVHIACRHNSHHIVEWLAGSKMMNFVNWNAIDNCGKTPEMVAEKHNCEATMLVLSLLKSFNNPHF